MLLHKPLALGFLEILAHHLAYQFRKADFRLPAQLFPCLPRVAEQTAHLGRTEVTRIDCHDEAPLLVVSAFVASSSFPAEMHPKLFCRGDDEFAHAVLLAGGDHEILGLFLLQHQPLRFHVLAGVAPVAPRLEVPEIEAVFEAEADPRKRTRDLAAHESLAPHRGFVVEQDAVAREKTVGFPVVDRYPIGVEFGDAVGRAGIERRPFALW